MSSSVAIVVEDELSDRIARRLIHHIRRTWTVGVRYPLKEFAGGRTNPRNVAEKRGLSGFGQIRSNLPVFNHAATHRPFFVLTDLDIHSACPGGVWGAWLPALAKNPNLIFRVAVKEVEAWLLADRENIADFLEIPRSLIPLDCELLADPKREIVALARQSASQEIIHALVPRAGSSAEVGRSFDRKMIQFVKDQWDIANAAGQSRSLERAINALTRFHFQPPS
jgi:hypothetical protein